MKRTSLLLLILAFLTSMAAAQTNTSQKYIFTPEGVGNLRINEKLNRDPQKNALYDKISNGEIDSVTEDVVFRLIKNGKHIGDVVSSLFELEERSYFPVEKIVIWDGNVELSNGLKLGTPIKEACTTYIITATPEVGAWSVYPAYYCDGVKLDIKAKLTPIGQKKINILIEHLDEINDEQPSIKMDANDFEPNGFIKSFIAGFSGYDDE